ncbi:uncharacterized protein LOC125702238 isoform X1 [Lagopus muta]|uniref:uncharacterized protein LOC125702238 isoform X1 n=1 Tax=Lagopus muta TaxID=64668 RepID=UPI0020A0FA40|nr:uncharacterized protein LOC125702238 isoform X1 [Lagopus muta]XP_048821197.1 uncharacterized protein LOC125702238 isoform X1 [Lagopus muta]XP_048821198.1 uncharacterized protein LOC125702238 isoform X1 [Lagopus muta]XP_048821199.1 uncharacterized protein LOC125702238 isoform X1 [Lagopus muta]
MGSACILWLCLLLLALPTPHAGVAVPRANHAERADGSRIVRTAVTVYYCKDCGEEGCKLSDYTDFEIIGETENEIFSNENIQLVINETHITMCFQQENMFRDGAYTIFWEKDEGLGEPCGFLKSGDSFEDRRHSVTEAGKICCETQTDHVNPQNALTCYTGATDENTGNHQYSVGENKHSGLTALFLILGTCAGGALLSTYYCKRRFQRHQGHIIVLQQTPPVNGETQLS